MSLARPPQKPKASSGSLLGRFIGFLIFLALIAVLVWSFSVTSGIDSFEIFDAAEVAPGEFVTLPSGQAIHYREQGTGTPVIFLHDFDVAGGYQWSAVAEGLSEYRVVIPDQVDFGFSHRGTEPGRQHTIVGRAEMVASFIEALEIDRAHLVGAGLGGTVAAQLAVDNPDLVDRLVLVAPEIYGPATDWYDVFYRLPLVGPALTYTTHGGGSRAVTQYQSECDTGWCPTAADLEYRQTAVMVRGTTAGLVAMSGTAGAVTVPAELPAITAPTLIIWGENDPVTPLSDGRAIDEAVPDSTIAVLAATGHRPHREDPAAVGALLTEFLGS